MDLMRRPLALSQILVSLLLPSCSILTGTAPAQIQEEKKVHLQIITLLTRQEQESCLQQHSRLWASSSRQPHNSVT